MISKVLTAGQAPRAFSTLSQYRVGGVRPTSPSFAPSSPPAFRPATPPQFLDKHLAADAIAHRHRRSPPRCLGYTVLDGSDPDPWRAAGPIRSGGTARLDIYYGGRVQVVEGQREVGTRDTWVVSAVHRERRVRYSLAAIDHVLMEFDDGAISARVTPRPGGVEVTVGERVYPLSWAAGEHQRGATDTHRAAALTAPMPGLVLKVMARPGQKVKAHQTLVVLEAMKMEHAIEAPHDGVVKAVHCKEGGRVGEGAVLVELEQK
jgi:biotin carboxyl carrier protein